MEMKSFPLLCAAVALWAVCASTTRAAIIINEVLVNPAGTDNGFEFIEFKSTTGGVEAMTGLTLLVIEGEGTATGVIDQAISLNGLSTGTNGLHLRRDAAAALSPAPAVGTAVSVADFAPDLENGAQTFAVVSGFSGVLGNDYDSDNNGVLDSTPWTSVLDAVGYLDNSGGSEFSYGAGLGGVSFPAAPAGFDIEAIVRLRDGSWVLADVGGTSPGPFPFDPAETINPAGALVDSSRFSIQTLTPGSANPVVPEPSALVLVGLAALGAFVRRGGR